MNQRRPEPPFEVDAAHSSIAKRQRSEVEHGSPDVYQRTLEATLGIPFTTGNRITVLKNGREIFPAMLEAIEQAEEEVDFLTYVYWTGAIAERFASTLAAKARSGVDVEVILDAYGAKAMRRDLLRTLREAGVDVLWFRPPTWRFWRYDNRTHRKILVCDGRVGFTGGVGIAEEWEGDARNPSEWRDTHFRVEGPAVHGIHGAFVGNWVEMGRQVRLDEEKVAKLDAAGDARVLCVRSVSSSGWSDIATLVQTLVQLAQRSLRITTPYFVPDNDTSQLLCDAAKRGVDVQIQVPGPYIDQRIVRAAARARYGRLLEAGVRIYQYQPTMQHTKCILVDDIVACAGSANFNHRSLRKDDEFCLVIIDPPTLRILGRHFEEDLAHCKPVLRKRWIARGWLDRIRETAAQTLQHQL